jgi:DNA-binding HxlR family transcriptional regulator
MAKNTHPTASVIDSATKTKAYEDCPIRNVISIFSDKWSLLVLTSLARCEERPLRYSDIQREMTDCSQKMLSQTLKKLCLAHLVERKAFAEIPPRVEYNLTTLGKSLIPHLQSLIGWALTHFREVTA